jgi:isoquinoline 1-oxidoreductase subunit alpha
MYELTINGKKHQLDVDGEMPLLWALRDVLGLTGTKYGCGVAQCGACTVHLEGAAVRSCILPVSMVAGKSITTIEGLSEDGSHPVQAAWVAENVPQCGFCQAGQIMSAAALLAANAAPTEQDIEAAMAGNLCRCGTYVRIRKAIQHATEIKNGRAAQ